MLIKRGDSQPILVIDSEELRPEDTSKQLKDLKKDIQAKESKESESN